MVVRWVLLSALLVWTVSGARAADGASCGSLTVGWVEWPHYQMTDRNAPDGPPVGIDITAVRDYFGELGCELQFVKRPWGRLLRDLADGRVQILPGASRTKERETFARFTPPYRSEMIALFLRRSHTAFSRAQRLSDLVGSGFRLGVPANSYLGEEFARLMENPVFQRQVMERVTGEDFRLIQLGLVDGFLTDEITGLDRLNNEALDGVVVVHPSIRIDLGGVHMMLSTDALSETLFQKLSRAILEERRARGF